MNKRIFHHFELWEDWKNGLYKKETQSEDIMNSFYELLKNPEEFTCKMHDMIKHWKYSAEVNITNTEINRKSWLGQATCCYCFGANEVTTIKAWFMLTEEEQSIANKEAIKIINLYQNLFSNQYICQKNT